MAKPIEKLAAEIRSLPDIEKLQLVDAILEDLVKPDPEIDRIWAEEARKRWNAYKAGRALTLSYDSVMAKHRRP
jgi:putative addiction module component (TIGR02574 family)